MLRLIREDLSLLWKRGQCNYELVM